MRTNLQEDLLRSHVRGKRKHSPRCCPKERIELAMERHRTETLGHVRVAIVVAIFLCAMCDVLHLQLQGRRGQERRAF